jgi:hypothetical protein
MPLYFRHHIPHEDEQQDLKRLFHIHSGGSEGTINYQIQTFKALCEFASFEVPAATAQITANGQLSVAAAGPATVKALVGSGAPTVHIDLHIHLPENKTTRDYEAIIQDIARYIYKQEVDDNGQ